MLLTKIGKKINRVFQFIEDPKLIQIWLQGISVDDYCMLNQPWLIEANINTVFDIGANVGEFALMISKILNDASIYSFEPLYDCCEKLKKRMRKVKRFKEFNIALADFNGELTFHRNEHSPSSSPLEMTDLHRKNYPYTNNFYTIKVRSVKLDDLTKNLKVKENILIKIDVQGFEDKVIAGGEDTIKLAKILIIETSFQPLYIGQPLFGDIYNFLKKDFRYVGALGNIRTSQIDGSQLFQDSIFVKN